MSGSSTAKPLGENKKDKFLTVKLFWVSRKGFQSYAVNEGLISRY
jgi:hypothetical protein